MSSQKRGRGRPAQTSFEDRIAQLESFHQSRGHMNVGIHQDDVDDNVELGKWLGQQRYRFRMGILDPDRAKRLCDMQVPGFEESVHGSGQVNSKSPKENSGSADAKKSHKGGAGSEKKGKGSASAKKQRKKSKKGTHDDGDEPKQPTGAMNSPENMMIAGLPGANFAGTIAGAGATTFGSPAALMAQQQYQEYMMLQQQFGPMGMGMFVGAGGPYAGNFQQFQRFQQQQQTGTPGMMAMGMGGMGMNMSGMGGMGMAVGMGPGTEDALVQQQQQQYAQCLAQQQQMQMQMQDALAMQQIGGGEHGDLCDDHDHPETAFYPHQQHMMSGGLPHQHDMMAMMMASADGAGGGSSDALPPEGDNSARKRKARKPRKPTNKNWKERVREIEEFQKERGHCDIKISINDPHNEELGRWLAGQRCRYRQGNLRPEKAQELAALGCSGFDSKNEE